MRLLILIVCLLMAEAIQARPVSYPGGWTVMEQHNRDKTSLHVHYSPTAKTSVGILGLHLRQKDTGLGAIQLNHLIKRWNKPASQANIYVKSGLGVAINEDLQRPAAFTGIALDWEDRRWFTSYENKLLEAGDIDRTFSQSARVGVAPYVAEFGSLHTWLMLQLDHTPGDRHPVTLTPLARFFYGPSLLEVGSDLTTGNIMLNFIQRF